MSADVYSNQCRSVDKDSNWYTVKVGLVSIQIAVLINLKFPAKTSTCTKLFQCRHSDSRL